MAKKTTKADKIRAILKEKPNLPAAKVAEKAGATVSAVYNIKSTMRKKKVENTIRTLASQKSLDVSDRKAVARKTAASQNGPGFGWEDLIQVHSLADQIGKERMINAMKAYDSLELSE